MTEPRITETRRHGQPQLAERLARSDIGFTGTGVPVSLSDAERRQLGATLGQGARRCIG